MRNFLNIAYRLIDITEKYPDNLAVAEPLKGRDKNGRRRYRTMTFAELDADTDRIATALIENGVKPGMRLALFVHYGIDFISLVFALCKAGAIIVLIDPGMGIRRMLDCLAEVEPDGFIAGSPVHVARLLAFRRFPKAKHNLTVGCRWFWGGLTLSQIRKRKIPAKTPTVDTEDDDLAAIIFTSGSTGPPKGVAFTHGNFDTQVSEISKRLKIKPGEIDLACFPFFGLFDALMGVTAVIPDMNTSKPAKVDPAKIVDAICDWNITQCFASPAVWNRVADYCMKTGKRMDSLRRAVSAGAPVSAAILEKLLPFIHPNGDIYTPYGATEALPVAIISASEVLDDSIQEETIHGRGVCVGRRFPTISWKIIEITDESIERIEYAVKMPQGEIGELVVSGPQVTKQYVNRAEANAAAKLTDSDGRIWHRMGDVGYIDHEDRFWFCGRKAHRVETPSGTLFSIPCESIFNQHPKIFRSALAASPYSSEARIFVEPYPEFFPKTRTEEKKLIQELLKLGKTNLITENIKEIHIMKNFPVDVRHNVKINRELLSTLTVR